MKLWASLLPPSVPPHMAHDRVLQPLCDGLARLGLVVERACSGLPSDRPEQLQMVPQSGPFQIRGYLDFAPSPLLPSFLDPLEDLALTEFCESTIARRGGITRLYLTVHAEMQLGVDVRAAVASMERALMAGWKRAAHLLQHGTGRVRYHPAICGALGFTPLTFVATILDERVHACARMERPDQSGLVFVSLDSHPSLTQRSFETESPDDINVALLEWVRTHTLHGVVIRWWPDRVFANFAQIFPPVGPGDYGLVGLGHEGIEAHPGFVHRVARFALGCGASYCPSLHAPLATVGVLASDVGQVFDMKATTAEA